jgi:hypothetical protein
MYAVDENYQELRKNHSRPEALQTALGESAQVKRRITDLKLIISPMIDKIKEYQEINDKLLNSARLPFETLMQTSGIESAFKNISNEMTIVGQFMNANKEFGLVKYLEEISKSAATVGFARDMTKELSLLKSASEQLAGSILDIQIKAAASTKTLGDSIRTYFDEYSMKTSALADALKLTSPFYDVLKESGRYYDKFSEKELSLIERFKLANETIYSSEKLVLGTNRYFSTGWDVPDIPRRIRLPDEIAQKKEELRVASGESEKILEIETNSSIIISNGIAYKFKGEIKDIKEILTNDPDFRPLVALGRRFLLLEDSKEFLEHLNLFAEKFGSKYWEQYWEIRGDKFVSHPERIARAQLGTYLEATFNGAAFIGSEIKTGNGFIDIYVHCLGIKQIVEIKMVGADWSIGNVEGGLTQLNEYMHSENHNEAYLVIFDGRKTYRGKQLNNVYDLEHGRVHVVTSKIYWKRPS